MRTSKRLLLEPLGWLLVLGGIAALVLPGPGLLLILGGLIVLSQQYDWAARRLDPIKKRALEAAADGVETWPRILMSAAGVVLLVAVGVVWGLRPNAPGWWPMADKWWLAGGWGTGASLIVSGLIALATIIYSYRNFRDIKANDPTP